MKRLADKYDLQDLTIYDLIDIAESYDLDIKNGINLKKLTYDQLVELIVESEEHYVVVDW
jgi:hypothetical protein